MSIAKPFTFVAGQKARANEVNADFDTLYSQVNTNIADIAQINRDIDNIESTKAEVDGKSTQRFAVANPVYSTDAVNKQTLNKSLTNVLDFINGLTIEKDTASPNDTILVNPGSCYDSTKQVILELSNITSKQNINQGANTTYYVYIVGNEAGTSIDILISNSSVGPTLMKFRNIGSFTTDSDNKIKDINSYSNTFSNSKSEVINWLMPDYSKGVSLSITAGDYVIPINAIGYVKIHPGRGTTIKVNNADVLYQEGDVNYYQPIGGCFIIPKNATVNLSASVDKFVYYPLKGDS